MARDNKGKFLPGESPNPNGRPKVAEEFRARARKAVDDHVIDAWILEVENLGDEWIRASELLAAYGYGKPSQAVELTGAGGGALEVLMATKRPEELTDDQLLAIAAKGK